MNEVRRRQTRPCVCARASRNRVNTTKYYHFAATRVFFFLSFETFFSLFCFVFDLLLFFDLNHLPPLGAVMSRCFIMSTTTLLKNHEKKKGKSKKWSLWYCVAIAYISCEATHLNGNDKRFGSTNKNMKKTREKQKNNKQWLNMKQYVAVQREKGDANRTFSFVFLSIFFWCSKTYGKCAKSYCVYLSFRNEELPEIRNSQQTEKCWLWAQIENIFHQWHHLFVGKNECDD